MPHAMCRAYTQVRQIDMEHVDYSDGTRERALLVATSRRRWQMSRILGAAALSVHRAYFEARGGRAEPFYFYDLIDERSAVYDPTGVATLGRRTVRFDAPWSQSAAWPRSLASIQLIEIN